MSEMIEVKTSDLVGLSLDWAVGIADSRELELPSEFRSRTCVVWCDPYVVKREGNPDFHDKTRRHWKPTTDWAHGGPLIDRHHVQTSFNGTGFSRSPTGEHWCAYVCLDSGAEVHPSGSGPSALIATCRAIVAAKLGDTVQVPKELQP